MKGLRIFIFITVATLVGIVLTFIILYIGWVGKENNPLVHPDKVQALTSILALVVGTAAALGSAIAALKLASLGLEISHQQERRDNIEFVDRKIESSINLFSEIAISIGEIFSSSIAVNSKIPHIDTNAASEKMNEVPDDELGSALTQLADNISKLSEQLKNIMKNEFSRACYYRALNNLNSKCSFLNKNLIQIDQNTSKHSVYTIEMSNLSDITSLLDLAQRRIQKGKLGDLIQAKLFANSPDSEIFNIPYDNANVRSFSFLGFLILSITSENRPLFIANYGAAILHDLFYALPDGQVFVEELNSRYLKLFSEGQSYKVDFDPAQITSGFFRSALTDTERIGNLYLLVEKSK
ncbi:MAG: hypothetical protein HGA37_16770 [Lentimicrobium sp.]|nr:hypothetical protein [Lentimicrobium sp.]